MNIPDDLALQCLKDLDEVAHKADSHQYGLPLNSYDGNAVENYIAMKKILEKLVEATLESH